METLLGNVLRNDNENLKSDYGSINSHNTESTVHRKCCWCFIFCNTKKVAEKTTWPVDVCTKKMAERIMWGIVTNDKFALLTDYLGFNFKSEFSQIHF